MAIGKRSPALQSSAIGSFFSFFYPSFSFKMDEDSASMAPVAPFYSATAHFRAILIGINVTIPSSLSQNPAYHFFLLENEILPPAKY